MVLKEIAFHLYYEKDDDKIQHLINKYKCSEDEATKKLYQNEWKDKVNIFDIQTRCICAMYTRILQKVQTKGVRKILLQCVQKEIPYKPYISFSVFDVPIQFDYQNFENSDNQKKKEITLETIYAALKEYYKMMDADYDSLIMTYNKIKELNYENIWTWRKKSSPDRKHTAELILHHEVEFIDFYIVIRDKSGIEIKRQKILSEVPDEWNYVQHLGELKWNSNSEVVLINKEKDRTWSAGIS